MDYFKPNQDLEVPFKTLTLLNDISKLFVSDPYNMIFECSSKVLTMSKHSLGY